MPLRCTPAVRRGPNRQLEVFGGPAVGRRPATARVLADQLAVAIDKRRLAAEAAEADKLAEIDAVRTALLRAVSHDLRTPLASIKAMVSGLRDPAVDMDARADRRGARDDRGGDRPPQPAGRQPARRQPPADRRARRRARPTVARHRGRLGAAEPHVDGSVDVDIADPRRLAVADPTLLERSLANVVSNALRHAPERRTRHGRRRARSATRSTCASIDRGPGMPARRSNAGAVTRSSDSATRHVSDGVGLGLSIAKGFVDAMHGHAARSTTRPAAA